MCEDWIVYLICDHLQKTVSAAMHPLPQRCHTLAQYSLKAVRAISGEHPRGAAAPGQPQQSPEGVVILDTQGTEGLFGVVAPQFTRV